MYLNLKFQKAFNNRDDSDDNLLFDSTSLIIVCNLEPNVKEGEKTQTKAKTNQEGSSGLVWHARVTDASNQSSSKWSQQV